jgi:hypothetical protein
MEKLLQVVVRRDEEVCNPQDCLLLQAREQLVDASTLEEARKRLQQNDLFPIRTLQTLVANCRRQRKNPPCGKIMVEPLNLHFPSERVL